MSITKIDEFKNDELPIQKPIKEIMNVKIPNLINGIPNRNGFIWLVTGSGGSGKTSMLLNFFKNKQLYRCKFDHIYYFCPEASFLSVEKHPFSHHDKVYHELTADNLNSVYDQVSDIKEKADEPEYNLVFIDDFADKMKDKDIVKVLSKFLVKTRHLQTAFIFTLQSYYLFPKQLRKIISNITIFKPKNFQEWESICKEMFDMNKDDALTLFHYVYNEQYQHLDVDLVENVYYKNFNMLKLHTKSELSDV